MENALSFQFGIHSSQFFCKKPNTNQGIPGSMPSRAWVTSFQWTRINIFYDITLSNCFMSIETENIKTYVVCSQKKG